MKSFIKMGLIVVLVAGFCFFLIALLAIFSPKPIASYVASELYFKDFQSYKNYFILIKYLMFIANAAMVGFLLSFYELKKMSASAWFTFWTVLSMLALGIGMFQSILDAAQIPHLAAKYEQAPPIVQHVIIAFGLANPAIYIISLGIPGIWFIFSSLAFSKEFGPALVVAGVAWGIGSILTVVAHVFIVMQLIYFVAFAALVGVPFWTFFQARFFLQNLQRIKG